MPVVSSPSVASLPAWISCSCFSRSSCSRRSISAVVSRRSPMMWIIALRLDSSRRLESCESLRMCSSARRELSSRSVCFASRLRSGLVVAEDVQHRLALVGEASVRVVQVAHDVEQRAAALLRLGDAELELGDALEQRGLGLGLARAERERRLAGSSARRPQRWRAPAASARAPSRARSSSARGRRRPPRTSPGRGSSPGARSSTPRGRARPARTRACRAGCRSRRSRCPRGRGGPRRSAWSGSPRRSRCAGSGARCG